MKLLEYHLFKEKQLHCLDDLIYFSHLNLVSLIRIGLLLLEYGYRRSVNMDSLKNKKSYFFKEKFYFILFLQPLSQ